MKTIGFQKRYTTDKDFVIVEMFEDGTSRAGIDSENYETYKNWPGKIPNTSGSPFVYIDEKGNVTYDSAGAATATTALAWAQVRSQRDGLITAITWRAERFERQKAANIPTADTAAQYLGVLLYIQALRDITKQNDPHKIIWPVITL